MQARVELLASEGTSPAHAAHTALAIRYNMYKLLLECLKPDAYAGIQALYFLCAAFKKVIVVVDPLVFSEHSTVSDVTRREHLQWHGSHDCGWTAACSAAAAELHPRNFAMVVIFFPYNAKSPPEEWKDCNHFDLIVERSIPPIRSSTYGLFSPGSGLLNKLYSIIRDRYINNLSHTPSLVEARRGKFMSWSRKAVFLVQEQQTVRDFCSYGEELCWWYHMDPLSDDHRRVLNCNHCSRRWHVPCMQLYLAEPDTIYNEEFVCTLCDKVEEYARRPSGRPRSDAVRDRGVQAGALKPYHQLCTSFNLVDFRCNSQFGRMQ